MTSTKNDRLSSVPLMNLHERRNYASNSSNVDPEWSDQEVEEFSRDPLESVLMQMRLWPQAITRQQCVQSSCFFSAISLCVGFLVAYLLFLFLYPPSNSCSLINQTDNAKYLKLHQNINSDSIKYYLRNLTETFQQIEKSDEEDKLFSIYISNLWRQNGLQNVRLEPLTVELSLPDKNYLDISHIVVKRESIQPTFTASLRQNSTRFDVKFSPYSRAGHTDVDDVVYVNFGREEDYKFLEELEPPINVSQKLVLIRLGSLPLNQIVSNAESRGAKVLLYYADPQQQIPVSHQIDLTSPSIGDRIKSDISSDNRNVKKLVTGMLIQPMSASDIALLFNMMRGHEAPSNWTGSLNVSYILESTFPDKAQMHVKVNNTVGHVEVYNIIGTLTGHLEPDRYVLIGSSRNPRIEGGLISTSVLMELVSAFGSLVREGWRPRRTLIFCNWDVTGSADWVQKYAKLLSDRAIAYINIDVALQGRLSVHTVPTLFGLVSESAQKYFKPIEVKSRRKSLDDDAVIYHSKSSFSNTMFPGLSNDYDGFLNSLGVPVIDVCYDTSDDRRVASNQIIKDNSAYYVSVAQVAADVASSLADSPLIPIDVVAYSAMINKSLTDIRKYFKTNINILSDFENAVKNFSRAATEFKQNSKTMNTKNPLNLCAVNDRMIQVERAFLQHRGLTCLPQYKHSVFATTESHETNIIFPCLWTAIKHSHSTPTSSELEAIKDEMASLSLCIHSAADVLRTPF